MNAQEGLQLPDLRGMLTRRAPVAAAVAGAVFLLSIVLAAVLPNQYEASTTILVEPQTISTQLVEAQMASTDLNARLHLMSMQILSRPRLSRIIDDLDLYEDESEQMTRAEVIELMRDQIRVEPVLPELEQTLRTVRRDIQINTFRLFFQSDRAALAAKVANRLASDFTDEHIRERVNVTSDTAEFIEAELARLAVQIQDVESRIAQVKAENPGKLPEDFSANQRLYERAVDNLRLAQRKLAEAESDEAFYRQQAAVSSNVYPQDAASPERRLDLLELQLAEYLSRGLTEKHPDIVATRLEIEQVKRTVAAGADLEGGEPPKSVAQQTAESEQRRAALQVRATQEEIGRLEAQVEEVQTRMAETPRVAEQLAALERDYEHLFESFQSYSNKRLEAAVSANMERRQKGEQFRVLEQAVPPPSPTSPNRPLIVLLGLFLGVALGAGVGVLMEAADPSFHVARDLQTAFRIPVLAQIPNIFLESDRVAQRRRRAVVAAATVAIVGVVLMGAAAGYFVVNGAPGWLSGGDEAEQSEPAPDAAALAGPGRTV